MAALRRLGALLGQFDALIAGGALALMLLIPLLEIGLRPLFGRGIENAPVLVQHLGLVLAMFGALVAERGQHLSSLGAGFAAARNPLVRATAQLFNIDVSQSLQAGPSICPETSASCEMGWVSEKSANLIEEEPALMVRMPRDIFKQLPDYDGRRERPARR